MTYTPVIPPYPHQIEARDKMRGRRAFALLMEPRTGKTKVMLDDWAEMAEAGEVHDLLYISYAGALFGSDAIETQVPQHIPPALWERTSFLAWRSAGGKGHQEAAARLLRMSDPGRLRVLLANVEALSSVCRTIDLCRDFLLSPGRRKVVVVGESTSIKGPSRRTNNVTALGRLAEYRRIETGTVAPNSPLDLFHQFNFLNPSIIGVDSWWAFRRRYAITEEICFLPKAQRQAFVARGRKPPTVTMVKSWRGLDELYRRIEPHSYRKRFRDCAAAPAGTYVLREVEMTAEQARIYRELRTEATSELSSGVHVTATRALTRVLRMHQVLCGFVTSEDGQERPVRSRRLAALMGLIEDTSSQVVVWAVYNHSVRDIVSALRLRLDGGRETDPTCSRVAAFWGGNLRTREMEEERFKSGDARVMVASQAAGGRGREWSCADLMVYYANSSNLEHREQSEMRVEGISKVDRVTRVDLAVPGTVDMKIIQCLRSKIDVASALQGDGYREWLV